MFTLQENRYQGPGPANWRMFNKEFLENENNLEILHITYEDLKKRTAETIKKINNFLGHTKMTEEETEQIVSATSYDRMKKTHIEVHQTTQGKCGTYKGKLTEDNIEKINSSIQKLLSDTDTKELNLTEYL